MIANRENCYHYDIYRTTYKHKKADNMLVGFFVFIVISTAYTPSRGGSMDGGL